MLDVKFCQTLMGCCNLCQCSFLIYPITLMEKIRCSCKFVILFYSSNSRMIIEGSYDGPFNRFSAFLLVGQIDQEPIFMVIPNTS